jgi:hypothetical protein
MEEAARGIELMESKQVSRSCSPRLGLILGGRRMSHATTVGACTYSWLWDRPLPDAVHRIADMGFKYFELMSAPPHCWPRAWSAAERAAFRRLYESLGLRLTSVNPTYLDINMASPNPGIRDESIRQLRENVQLAHDLGAGVVVAPGGRKHVLIAPDQSYVWALVKGALESLLGLRAAGRDLRPRERLQRDPHGPTDGPDVSRASPPQLEAGV